MNMKLCIGIILVILCAGHTGYANESASQSAETIPIRMKKRFTVSYHSHWFLIGGLRGAYRISNARTEVNAMVGSSVVTGCGIQAPKCEQGAAFNVGIRRYASPSAFSVYGGINLHGLLKGMRGTDRPLALVDVSLGFNHQTSGSFNWGLGYSGFIFDGDKSGFDPKYARWILSEFGYSF